MYLTDTKNPQQAGASAEGGASANSRTNFTTPAPDREEIVKALGVLFEPGDVGELRVLRSKPKQTDSGYFEVANSDYIADFAARYNNAGQVYVVMNRAKPDMLARAANRIIERADKTTQDADIQRRRWFLIDLDPKRSAGISASDAELEAAKRKAVAVREFLAAAGWPPPTVAESGNGIHLLYPIDMPNDDAGKGLIQGALKGLAARFGDKAVEVDQTVFNAARITKLYGTVAKKGDHVPARPWRLARILEAPGRDALVTPEQLSALHLPKDEAQKNERGSGSRYNGAPFDLDAFMSRLGIGYDQDTHDGSARYKLAHCPFNPEHGKGEAAIFRHPSGGLGFKCQHNSCADKKWRHVRELVDGPKESRARPHAADARETNQRARVEAADVEALIVSSLTSAEALDKARKVLAALPSIPKTAALGGGENKAPLIASRAIAFGASIAYKGDPATTELGRALCAFWDGISGGTAAKSYDRADPNYQGNPVTLDSVFKLARENGWTGAEATAAAADDHDGNVAPPKPNEAMLYGLVGDVGRAAALDTEVNPIAAAAAFLGFLGANVGRDVFLKVGDAWHHPRLFVLHVGRSGRGRKGDSIALVHRIRRRLDEVYAGTLGQTHTGGLSTREGLALMVHDGYREGKKEVEPIHDKRLWIVESEFANVLHQGKRDGNTLSAALRDAWDGVSIRPAIKTARVWASRPHIGLHGCVTPGELLSLMESRELTNGFANRFLMVWAEKTGSVPFPQATPNSVVNDLAERAYRVIAFAKGKYPDESDSREMRLTDEASRIYADAYRNELDRPQESDTLTGLLERQAPYVLRLAALFALTDKTLWIDTHHMNAALAWAMYVRESVRYIFAPVAGVAESEQRNETANKIVEFLRSRQTREATRTELVNDCFNKKGSASAIDAALNSLMASTPPQIELIERPRANGKPGNATKVYRIFSTDRSGTSGISGMRETARDSAKAESGGTWRNVGRNQKANNERLSSFRQTPPHSETAETEAGRHIPLNPLNPPQAEIVEVPV